MAPKEVVTHPISLHLRDWSRYANDARNAERSLRSFVEPTLDDAAGAVEIKVVEGVPVDTIQRIASNVRADLIVMGTHGRTGLNRWMLGSVAERVLRESSVPVLTVRARPPAPIRHIPSPVNDTQLSRHALTAAMENGACLDAAVTVLHVGETRGLASVADLCEWVGAENRSRCQVREWVQHGDRAEEIVALASNTPCDLLVIGAPGQRFFDGMVLSRTALRVVRHAPCPVLSIGGSANAGGILKLEESR